MPYSDYIIFADESGSPVLEAPDPTFPMFVLAMLLVSKETYLGQVAPLLGRLKLDFVGHDQLILHERDIRRQQKDFAFLQADPAAREAFLERVNEVVAEVDIEAFAAVIHKIKLSEKYAEPWSPYQIALHFLLEKLLGRLLALGEAGKLVHVVFESRGKREDQELELQFRRIVANQANWGWRAPDFTRLRWEPLFVDKKSNSAGLQLADLMARPIGLRALRPHQPNRAYDVIAQKLAFPGFKVFP